MSDKKSLDFSRRGFLKGALAGAGVATLGFRDVAAQILSGPTANPVRGWGVPPGMVRLSGNEMPIGPSPRALEAITKVLYSFNRYGRVSEIYTKIHQAHKRHLKKDRTLSSKMEHRE